MKTEPTTDFSGALDLEHDVVAVWTGEIVHRVMTTQATASGECLIYVAVSGVRGSRIGSASVSLEPQLNGGFRSAHCADRKGGMITTRDWARVEGAILARVNRAVR